MSTRESRRLKERRSIIPFGDIMLPVIGLVAVGLLVAGVKLFFQPGSDRKYEPVMSAASAPADPQQGKAAPGAEKAAPAAAQSSVRQEGAAVPSPSPSKTRSGVMVAVPAPSGEEEKTEQARSGSSAPSPSQELRKQPSKAQKSQETANAPEDAGTPPQASGGWSVQLGAFASRGGAEAVRQKAVNAGFKATVAASRTGEKTMYRVTVPAGKERSDADALAAKLKKAGFEVFVVAVR